MDFYIFSRIILDNYLFSGETSLSEPLSLDQDRNRALLAAAAEFLKLDLVDLHDEIKTRWARDVYVHDFGRSSPPKDSTLYKGGPKNGAAENGERIAKIIIDSFCPDSKKREGFNKLLDDWRKLPFGQFKKSYVKDRFLNGRSSDRDTILKLDGYVYFVTSPAFQDDRKDDPTNEVIGYFIVKRGRNAWRIDTAEAWYARKPLSLKREDRRGKWDAGMVAGTTRDLLMVYQFEFDASNQHKRDKDYRGLFAVKRRENKSDPRADDCPEFEGKFYKLTHIGPKGRNDGEVEAKRILSSAGNSDEAAVIAQLKEGLTEFVASVRRRRI